MFEVLSWVFLAVVGVFLSYVIGTWMDNNIDDRMYHQSYHIDYLEKDQED